MQGKFVSYIRVSTARQGKSGLGLDAQQQAVARFIGTEQGQLLREFVEIESGKEQANRPELQKALAHCKRTGASLVIAKLDRLSRDAEFMLGLQKRGVPFVIAEMPRIDNLTVGFLAVLAQHEREVISRRTKDALAVARKRLSAQGRRLGNPNGARALQRAGKGNGAAIEAVQARADERAAMLAGEIADLRAQGIVTLTAIACALNERGMRTPRGGRWHASSVRNLVSRLSQQPNER
jgi:DNA invertase Pin-like site-specific DNA recombinase